MDSPTDTRMRPGVGAVSDAAGGRKSDGCRRTAVSFAHQVEVDGGGEGELGSENQYGFAEYGDDEEGDCDDRGRFRNGGDANNEGGEYAYETGCDGEAAAVWQVETDDGVHNEEVAAREHEEIAEAVTRRLVKSVI